MCVSLQRNEIVYTFSQIGSENGHAAHQYYLATQVLYRGVKYFLFENPTYDHPNNYYF